MALASGSPLQEYVSASKSSVRPRRYEMFARCTSVVEMAPSSMGAFRSECLRLRTASMKLAQLLPASAPDGPGACSRPRKLLYLLWSSSQTDRYPFDP